MRPSLTVWPISVWFKLQSDETPVATTATDVKDACQSTNQLKASPGLWMWAHRAV